MEALRLEYRDVFVYASLILAAAGFVPYIWAIWRDRHNDSPKAVKPSKSSWIIWFTLTSLTAGGMFQAGTLNAQQTVYVIGDIPVLFLALRFGKPGWSKLDKWCLAGAGIGVGLWYLSTLSIVAIGIGMSVTLIGTWPTYEKIWRLPYSEPMFAWGIATFTSGCASLAVVAWTFEYAMAPVGYFLIQGSMLILMFLRRRHALAPASV